MAAELPTHDFVLRIAEFNASELARWQRQLSLATANMETHMVDFKHCVLRLAENVDVAEELAQLSRTLRLSQLAINLCKLQVERKLILTTIVGTMSLTTSQNARFKKVRNGIDAIEYVMERF